MTKPIICAALLTLYEEGCFQLFDPVAKYLPQFGKVRVLTGASFAEAREVELARPITVRDLFTHTAGLTYGFLADSPVSELYRQTRLMSDVARTLEATIAELARLPLAYQPGSRWHYSVSIDVLAHLIEVLAGQPLQDFLQARLFGPLGMTDTGFFVPVEKRARLSAMYGHPDIATHSFSDFIAAWQQGRNERREVDATYPVDNTHSFARGGHGLYSTMSDYLRFAQMLLGRGEFEGVRILSPRITDYMHVNHVPVSLLPLVIGPAPMNGYGFGLGSRVLLNPVEAALPVTAGEFGWAGAAKTFYWVDPKEELIGILMSQYMMCFELPDRAFQVLAYQALLE
jgi:CubicO group peptidase (beta-lactamase class C family)